MHWLFKFWIFVALIACLAALLGILLHQMRGDSKLAPLATPSRNKARVRIHESKRLLLLREKVHVRTEASQPKGKEGTDNVRNRNGNSQSQ